MPGFEELLVWRAAVEMAKEIYRVSELMPFKRDWSLKDQIRRAAVSIPSNIAEGHQRKYRRDFARFLTIALGSVGEMRTQLIIAVHLGYLAKVDFDQLTESARHLSSGIDRLRTSVLRQAGDAPP